MAWDGTKYELKAKCVRLFGCVRVCVVEVMCGTSSMLRLTHLPSNNTSARMVVTAPSGGPGAEDEGEDEDKGEG